jgi:methionine-rich copper-binding protein CopC
MKTLIISLGLALLATPALAHAHLGSSTPADGAAVAEPASITIKFTETVEGAFTGVTVTGPQGDVTLGTPALDPGDGETLVVPIAGAMPAGRYTVSWHALATDGHKSEGSFVFAVAK